MSTARIEHPIDEHVAIELEHIAANGVPSLPRHLDLHDVTWAGAACPKVLQAESSTMEPWGSRTVYCATVGSFGSLTTQVGWHGSKANEAQIRTFAVAGMEQQLVDRVRSAENERPTSVQRVFLGEHLPWTREMDDAQLTRHGVAHHGVMPGPRPISWDGNIARVGLAKTLLTAMISKLIRYDGPIADRARTCSNLTGDFLPSWWPVVSTAQEIVYLSGAPKPALTDADASAAST